MTIDENKDIDRSIAHESSANFYLFYSTHITLIPIILHLGLFSENSEYDFSILLLHIRL